MKRWVWIGIATILLAVLAGGAFMAGQLLGNPTTMTVTPGILSSGFGRGGSLAEVVGTQIEHAAELPDSPAALSGILVRRADNRIFVGTGAIGIRFNTDAGGEPIPQPFHDGPVTEVVVSHDTIIYRDETPFEPTALNQTLSIQQVVRRVDSLEEIGQNALVDVWGERRGDRIVAQVLVYWPLESVDGL